MKRILSILALATFTLTSCSTDPCGNLVGYEKDSCLQCQETGGSDYFRTVRKPKDFPTVNLDSLMRFGDSSLYLAGTASYDILYTLQECSDTEDVVGFVVINYHSSSRSPEGAAAFLPYGSVHRYRSSHLFRYQIDKNGVIGPVTF
tara:strand:+ start:2192 stop:2629 length:438 start_codon:yes stop_codon:yes gene_type:complete